MDQDAEWRLVEWVEGPAAERRSEIVLREVRDRHPELAGLSDDWLRLDLVCERGGVTRKRFMVRTTPPPPRPRRKRPRAEGQ